MKAAMSKKVLHILSQRPLLTGSGVTLDALVRHGVQAGWDQWVVVGVPLEDDRPAVGGLAPGRIRPLVFGKGPLSFAIPGMSDVMPYPSTRFSQMSDRQIAAYLDSWRQHLGAQIDEIEPDVIHVHHIWLVGSIVKELAPGTPVVNHCHATGFRQMTLCPHLAHRVRAGCAKNDRFAALHKGHSEQLASTLDVSPERISEVKAGYRDDLFVPSRKGRPDPYHIVYVGKYSAAKGLPWLLDAVERLAPRKPGLTLHVAGSGQGREAQALRQRMRALAPMVVLHGQMDQAALARLMQRCALCVLPSFFEGLPLVLVEAYASGCRIVSTDLPGVASELAVRFGDAMERIALPRLIGSDQPHEHDLPAFVEHLTAALESALEKPPMRPCAKALAPFTWKTVFLRVETLWKELIQRSEAKHA